MKKTNVLVRPFLKWAGGKRQLLSVLKEYVPQQFGTYYEPFLGGGALFLDLQAKQAVVSDSNEELINCYEVVRNAVEELILTLEQHPNIAEHYYEIREWDRSGDYAQRPCVDRAARIIYLNKTCFNGLFRVNSQGQFNVPFGQYTNPNIVDKGVLRAVHEYLRSSNVTILHEDFEKVVSSARRGDFIYLDPPYDPVSSTASFTRYDVNGFGKDEQRRLKGVFDDLSSRECNILLSNAYTPFIADLYQEYRQVKVEASRAINSNGNGRGKVEEILVMNYG